MAERLGLALSERWLNIWALVLNGLSDSLNAFDAQCIEIAGEIDADPLRRRRLLSDLEGVSWASLYELPPAVFFWRCGRLMFSPLQLARLLGGVASTFRWPHEWATADVDIGGREPSLAQLPRVFAGMKAWTAQTRAYVIYQRSMSELIAAGRAGDDDAFVLAVRIDPAAICAPSIQRRIQLAAALGETDNFITRMATALREPVSAEMEHSRLQSALLLMAKAKQIGYLNEAVAAELFINRTHLYPAHGRKDAQRSLWRFIQRWKKDHATLIRGKMSS